MTAAARDLLWGGIAGLAGTWAMDRFSGWLYERLEERTREREESLREEMPTVALARKGARLAGLHPADPVLRRTGMAIHWAFGAAWGAAAAWSQTATGWNPLVIGVGTGIAVWILFDEGANAALGLTPPPHRFPLATHARSLANHVVYGSAIGVVIGAATLLGAR